MLYGFPGEESKDYEENLEFVKALSHLPPPEGCGPLRLDRFSPYFDFPKQFGIRNLRALRSYRYLFPFDESVLYNLAYFFEYDFDGREMSNIWVEPVSNEVESWRKVYKTCRLEVVSRQPDVMVVSDTRFNRILPEYHFRSPENSIIDFCDSIRTFNQIAEHLHSVSNGSSPAEPWLQHFLEYMLNHRLMLRSEDSYLSLIMPQPAGPPVSVFNS
jgi:hypothetical protein